MCSGKLSENNHSVIALNVYEAGGSGREVLKR